MTRIVPRLPFGYPADHTGQPNRDAPLLDRIAHGGLRSPVVVRPSRAPRLPPPAHANPPIGPNIGTTPVVPVQQHPPAPTLPIRTAPVVPPPAPTYVTSSGRSYPSSDVLPHAERVEFMQLYDPVEQDNLGPETLLYRSLPEQYVVNGRVQGHRDVDATIDNHLAIRPHPNYAAFRNLPEPLRPTRVLPVRMVATELTDPSVNVTFGNRALQSALAYRAHGWQTVEMRLGDFQAAGGTVFRDAGAFVNNALVITLPEGSSVPARTVDPAEAQAGPSRTGDSSSDDTA